MRERNRHLFFSVLLLMVSHSAFARQAMSTVAGDRSGNILITDSANSAVREVAAETGVISIVPGDGNCSLIGSYMVASAEFGSPLSPAIYMLDRLFAAGPQDAATKHAAPRPTFSPAPGTYTTPQLVTLNDAVAGAAIHYTTNGKTPNTSSPLYSNPISVAGTTTIKAIAIASGYLPSSVASGKYVIEAKTATPSFSPPPGSYWTTQSVKLADATGGASIYYTIDGSTPTTKSKLYKGVAIKVAKTTTIKTMAVAHGAVQSDVAVGLYTMNQASPVDPRAIAQQGIGIGLATQTMLSQMSLALNVLVPGMSVGNGACGNSEPLLFSFLQSGQEGSIRPTIPSMSTSPGYGTIFYDNNCAQPWINAELTNWAASYGQNTFNLATDETASFSGMSGSVLGEMTLSEAFEIDSTSFGDGTASSHGLGSFTPAGGGSTVQLGLACSLDLFDVMMNGEPTVCYGAIAQDLTSLNLSLGFVLPLNVATTVSPGITWSGTQLVAVSSAGSIFTSPNGTTWTSRSSGTDKNLRAVVWSGSQFVAVGSGGTILTSPDGAAWTSRSSGTTVSLAAVTWSGTQFVAVGSSGTILTSGDGSNWTVQPSGTNAVLEGVAWSGTRFVAVGGSMTLTTVLTSTDGKTWTNYSPPTNDGPLVGVTWSGGQFVAVGSVILTSSDGINWLNMTPPALNGTLLGVTGSGSQFVAVGSTGVVFTSANGWVWTPQASGSTWTLRAVTWTGNQFVAIGYANVVQTSPNGSSWTTQTSAPGYGQLVHFGSSGSSVVSGALGALQVTAPTTQTLEITGGTPYGTATLDGYAGGFSMFPPTPTGWTVIDQAHDQKFNITVGDNATRNLSGTITRISTGATLATIALDRSGTGAVRFSDGGVVAVTNWLQAN
jgi:hypothetical protein